MNSFETPQFENILTRPPQTPKPPQKPREGPIEHNEIEIGPSGEMIVKRQTGPFSDEEPATVNKAEISADVGADFMQAQNIFNSLSKAEKRAVSQEIDKNLCGVLPNEYQKEFDTELQRIINERFSKNFN